MSDRVRDIDAELKELNQTRRELLAERRQLIADRKPEASGTSEYWADPIFSIIESHPGISRDDILFLLETQGSRPTKQVFTNTLTMLRRRGWIENQGTRKHPEWHARGRLPRSRWNTRVSATS